MSRVTHTYALLQISQAAYNEIREKLQRNGYSTQFHRNADGTEVIDMHGLAVTTKDPQGIQDPPKV